MPDDHALAERFRALLRAEPGTSRERTDEPTAAGPASQETAAPHPAAPIAPASGDPRFLIVTPVFNAGAFIDEAIASVLRQALPDHRLHYHVQDGGSTDGTLDRLRAWQRRMSDESHVPDGDRIVFTFASERDGGMYDALQRGFTRLAPRDQDILTWINSDDCLAQGALVTVAGVFRDVPDCEFLSGRTALLNEEGAVVMLGTATPYARDALAEGLHDGRTLPFIMQEGTFYSGRLWNAVGGVDPAFRLAGDWDLWRRMARVARHCVVDSVTGYHRRRAGQLSGDIAAYHREIDTAPVLPAATDLGSLGTFIMYDVATARWVETAFDPAAVATPKLLRDSRSEASVICRPVIGFAAPEGPYPQYQLPGGIRWIDGHYAEIAMQVPASGRYRIRLTLRPSRQDLVLGLGVGARARRPITLEPPAPRVDQIVETVRWLDAGERRLCLDCDGSPDIRSILLIRCEVTSIDENFLRRPTLPPVRSGRDGRPAPAIAILCEDDEPDLLDISLADCAATMPDAAVFVVSDPQNAALERVIRSRQDGIAGRIDGSVRPDAETLRRTLRAAGNIEILFIQRGSTVTPRGMAAALALLDASGAGAAGGLVNERDSAGRSLRLSDPKGNAPVLCRTTGATDVTVRIGCALAQAVGRPDEACDTPVMWLIDGDRPMLGRTPATVLAGALALLGYDVRHVVVPAGSGADQWPALPPSASIIVSEGLVGPSSETMTIGRDGDRLRLAAEGAAIELPLAADTDLLLPRDRRDARERLGFAPDERIVCIAETSAQATAATITWVTGMAAGPARILNFGHPPPPESRAPDVLALDDVADPLLLSYLLSAADAAVTAEPGGGLLAGAAWSCGLAVLDLNGETVDPAEALRCSTSAGSEPADARDLMVATRSLAALAIAIDERCPALSRGASPLRLRSGLTTVRSYARAHQPGGFDRIASFSPVTALGAALPFVAADGELGQSIGECGGEIIVSLDRPGVTTLRLHVRGAPGDAWIARAGGGTTMFGIGKDGDAMVSVDGRYDVGPTRIMLERQDGDEASTALLHIVGLSQTGVATTLPEWEETRFELVSADARPAPTLEIDGDWQRSAGFLPEQAPVPPVGMYVPFYWNEGDSCRIRLRVTTGGPRVLHLALAAGMRGQRVRLVVAGRTSDWCTPLVGPIGHVERRMWLVDWPTGDIEVTLEISDVLRTMPQEVGLMLFGVTLERP